MWHAGSAADTGHVLALWHLAPVGMASEIQSASYLNGNRAWWRAGRSVLRAQALAALCGVDIGRWGKRLDLRSRRRE